MRLTITISTASTELDKSIKVMKERNVSWWNLKVSSGEQKHIQPESINLIGQLISYFNVLINIIVFRDATFSRALKISFVFFSHHKFCVKISFHHATKIFTFFNHIINQIVNCIFALVCSKRLNKTYHQHILIYSHNCK